MLALALTFNLIFPWYGIQPVVAQVITDPNADISFQPTINNRNGVPVVDIVAPDNSGISHNQYQDFDVDDNGLVFNNSLTSGTSNLVGNLIANPNLGGRTAGTILNEVTGISDSRLTGTMEVFGSTANVIIANPNGVTCNGCGFINTDRASLIVGSPRFIDGNLKFNVDSGEALINGEGLSYRYKPTSLDVLARYVSVNGEVGISGDLNLIAGVYEFDYSKSQQGAELQDVVAKKTSVSRGDRALAVDASVFGAMQAGRINIMGTEQGLGVKADGYLFSSVDDLFIQSAGALDVSDADSYSDIKLQAESDVTINDDLIANQSISVIGRSITTADTSSLTTQKIDIDADGQVTLSGQTKSLALTIDANTVDSTSNILALETADINASDKITLTDGEIGAAEIILAADDVILNGASFSANQLSAEAENWQQQYTNVEVGDFSLTADYVTFMESEIVTNNLLMNAATMEAETTELSGQSGELNTTSANFSSAHWVFNNSQIDAYGLSLDGSLIMSYDGDIKSAELTSKNSQYISENLDIQIDGALISNNDIFQILPFNDSGDTETGTLTMTSGSAEFTDTGISAKGYTLVTDQANLNSSYITAADIDLNNTTTELTGGTQLSAINSINVEATDFDSEAIFMADTININSNASDLSGQYIAENSIKLDTIGDIRVNDALISAQDISLSGDDIAISATTLNSAGLQTESVADTEVTASNIISEDIALNAGGNIDTDKNTALNALTLTAQAYAIDNAGDMIAYDEIHLDSSLLQNSGDIVSYTQALVETSQQLLNNGNLVSVDLDISTSTLGNHGNISADNLALIYQNISNNSGAEIASGNASFTARTDSATFTNNGTHTITGDLTWNGPGSATGAATNAGYYNNNGLLQGINLHFDGLQSVSNGSTEDSSATISAQNSLLIGNEDFSQNGIISADSIRITKTDDDNFANDGTIKANDLTASLNGDLNNSGSVSATSITLVTDSAGHTLNNQTGAKFSSSGALAVAGFSVENNGTLVASSANISGNDSATFNNTGVVAQRDGDNGAGALTLSDFSLLTNGGAFDIESLLTINHIHSVNNNGVADGDGMYSGALAISDVESLENESMLISGDSSIAVGQLNNDGFLAASGGNVSVTGLLQNTGHIYQSSNSATHEQLNINTNTITNTANASIELVSGNLAIVSGVLSNSGLINELASDNNTDVFNLTGLRSLDNQGDISLNGNVSLLTGGSLKSSQDTYLKAGGLNADDLSEVNNKGTLIFGNDVSVAAEYFTNDGEWYVNGAFDVNAGNLTNNGIIESTQDSEWNFLHFTNTESAKINISGATLTLTAEDYASGSTLNNNGGLYAGSLDIKGVQTLTNNAQMAAYGKPETSHGELTIDARTINNNGLLYAAGSFQLSGYRLNNNGNIGSLGEASNNYIQNKYVYNGNGSDSTGTIQVDGNLILNNDHLYNQSYQLGGELSYIEVLGYHWTNTGCIGCSSKSAKFYPVVDFLYGNYTKQQGSLISAGGNVQASGGVFDNNSSALVAGGALNISGLDDFNNNTLGSNVTQVQAKWYKKYRSEDNKDNYRDMLNSYKGKLDQIAGEISVVNDQYYWSGINAGAAINVTETEVDSSTISFDGNQASITADTLITGVNSDIRNNGNISVTHIGSVSSDEADAGEAVAQGSFQNGTDGVLIDLTDREPSAAISLVSFIIPGLDHDALNSASVAGDKTPEELAAQDALQNQLDELANNNNANSDSLAQNAFGYTSGSPSLFDLDADILSQIIADTEYELQPDYIFDQLSDSQQPDIEPSFFLDPYQEAQAITQAALAQTGTAYFSPDWSSSAEQRQTLYNNTVSYLTDNQGQSEIRLGQALTKAQISRLEEPMIWYVTMNIGGTEQLVPTVYLPEATLDQITTPSAGTLVADTMDIETGKFTNTGTVKVSGSANIYAQSIANQRNVMTFGDDINYSHYAAEGGSLSAGSLMLSAANDITNNGGAITTRDDLTFNAGGDINFNALELSSRFQNGRNIDETTRFQVSDINAGGNAIFNSAQAFNTQAANIDIAGNTLVNAEDINLLGVTEREYQQRYSKKSGTFSSSKKTVQTESLTFVGTDLQSGGSLILNAGKSMMLQGAGVSAGEDLLLNAGNDILITAGISQDSYSKEKSGSGVATTSAQQKGYVTQQAVGSSLNAGGNLQINSDGGNVDILASNLSADKNMILGDSDVLRDENNQAVLDDNGQYISKDGSSIDNLTVGTVELKDESWNEKQSGLKGPLKSLVSATMFVAGSMGVTSQLEALGVDTTVTVGKTDEVRTETTHHATSTVNAGQNLFVRADGDFTVEGSDVSAGNRGYIEAENTHITAVLDTTTHTERHSEQTLDSTEPTVGQQEITVAGVTATDTTTTDTTTSTSAQKSSLSFGGDLQMNSAEDINLIGSELNVGGDAALVADNISVTGIKETTTTTHKEKTEVSTTSLGVKNAYVDAVYAADAVAQAGADVEAAENALSDAQRRVKEGTLAESALDDYKTNLAAATTQLTQATLAMAASGATAAATTGTGGFYASASAQTTTTEKESTSTSETYVGSEITVGGNASFNADNTLDIVGSGINVQNQLALNGGTVNITAGTEESSSSSSEQTYSSGMSFSNSAGNSFGANASANSSESDNESKQYVNSNIRAGSLDSNSEQLAVAGANIEIQNDININTGDLTIASLQDESHSSSHSEGYNINGSMGGNLPIDPGSMGGNQSSSSSDSQWVNNQTTLIGGGDVNINADSTTIEGAVLASASRNDDGTLTDNGNLNLITDELKVTDLYDHDTSESSGINISVGTSGSGTSTLGLSSDGHNTEQTTYASLGNGNVQTREGEGHDLENTNRDLNNTQEVTLDQQTAGLDAEFTVDHRWATEEGRNAIKKDFIDTGMHVGEIAQAASDVASTDQGILDFYGNVQDYATEREVLAQQAADEQQQKKLKGEEGAEGSEEGLQKLSDALTDAQGLENGADISLYDGSQLQDSTLAIDSTAVNKTEVEGAYHENGDGIYVNIDNTDMTNSTDTVSTLVHEQTRHRLAQEGQTGSLSRDDQTTLATNHGDRAGEVWDAYSGLAGISTQGNGTQQQWNATNQNSSNVQQGTQNIAAINNNELKARQLNRNEASLLDQARANINNKASLSAEQKVQEIADLNALACAEVNCAAGVSPDDPLYEQVSTLQSRGQELKAQGEDIKSTLNVFGVNTQAADDDFAYGLKDKIDDKITSHENIVAGTQQAAATAGGMVEAAGGTAIAAGGCVATAGVGCGLAIVGGGALAAHGTTQAIDSYKELTADHQYQSGSNVLNSLSAETHPGEVSPTTDALVGLGISTLEVAGGAAASKVAGTILKEGSEVAGNAATQARREADVADDVSSNTANRAGDVDGEMINLNQPATIDDVASIPKGERPDPSTYMSQTDLAEHEALFDEGAVRFTSRRAVEEYGTAGSSEAFVMPKSEFDNVLKESGGDLRVVEQKLGLDLGYLGDKDTMAVYIKPEDMKDIKIPSGNEAGANNYWIPGGKTSGGVSEGVLDLSETPFTELPLGGE
tara:strand:+ start:45613 stop:56226 length:10614 start_codon:yes stop_codon:yes gene_type:complete